MRGLRTRGGAGLERRRRGAQHAHPGCASRSSNTPAAPASTHYTPTPSPLPVPQTTNPGPAAQCKRPGTRCRASPGQHAAPAPTSRQYMQLPHPPLGSTCATRHRCQCRARCRDGTQPHLRRALRGIWAEWDDTTGMQHVAQRELWCRQGETTATTSHSPARRQGKAAPPPRSAPDSRATRGSLAPTPLLVAASRQAGSGAPGKRWSPQKPTPSPARMKKSSCARGCTCGVVRWPLSNTSMPDMTGTCEATNGEGKRAQVGEVGSAQHRRVRQINTSAARGA